MTTSIISIVQLIIAVGLIILVLIQDSGSGVGESFGGTEGGGISRQRRGLEKLMHRATIVGLVLFAGASVIILLLQ